MYPRWWSQEDFEAMSWHDCHVHSLRVAEGTHGSGVLELDIDYILEWRQDKEKYIFLVVPAKLSFHEVTDLHMSIDWKTPSAAMGPFSIAGVERTFEARANYKANVWRLPVNWPSGLLAFEASGFTQESWGREVISPTQILQPPERSAA